VSISGFIRRSVKVRWLFLYKSAFNCWVSMSNRLRELFFHFSLLLLATRAWLDPVFDMFKQGGGVGVGGVLNALVILLGFCVLVFLRNGREFRFILLWFPIVFLSGVSVFYSPSFIDSLRAYLAWLSYFVMFFIGYRLVYLNETKLLVRAIYISFYITSLVSVYHILFGGLVYSDLEGNFRLTSSFSHPNIYAFYLVFVISISFYFLVRSGESVFPLEHRFVILSGLVFLVLTQTRSAWLGMVFIFFVYLFLNNRKLFYFVLILSPLLLFLPIVGDRFSDVFTGSEDEFVFYYERMNSYVWRKVVWQAAWGEILKQPFFGYGYNSFEYYFMDFFPYGATTGMDAHNSYIQIAFDSGLFAAVAYAGMLVGVFAVFMRFLPNDRKGVSVLVGLVGFYILSGYSDNVTFYLNFNWYFWFFVGFSIRVCHERSKECG